MLSFNCPKCQGTDIVMRGKRYNKSGVKQLYFCNECSSTMVEPDGFERMRFSKDVIARAIHMYNDGFSLFKTQYHLYQHDNVKVTRRTISQWAKKYSNFLKSSTLPSKTKTKRKTAFRRKIRKGKRQRPL